MASAVLVAHYRKGDNPVMAKCENCENEMNVGQDGAVHLEHRFTEKGACNTLLDGKIIGFARSKWKATQKTVKERNQS